MNLGDWATLKVTGDWSALVGKTIPIPASVPAGSAINRRAVALGTYPEAPEAEPNDEPAVAQTLAIPSNGERAIWTREGSRPGAARADQDLFRFTARKGQKVVLDVTAQQLGSPLDSRIPGAGRRPARRAARRDRCVAQTELSLNDPDSNRRRACALRDVERVRVNDHLLIGDELLQIASMPTHRTTTSS